MKTITIPYTKKHNDLFGNAFFTWKECQEKERELSSGDISGLYDIRYELLWVYRSVSELANYDHLLAGQTHWDEEAGTLTLSEELAAFIRLKIEIAYHSCYMRLRCHMLHDAAKVRLDKTPEDTNLRSMREQAVDNILQTQDMYDRVHDVAMELLNMDMLEFPVTGDFPAAQLYSMLDSVVLPERDTEVGRVCWDMISYLGKVNDLRKFCGRDEDVFMWVTLKLDLLFYFMEHDRDYNLIEMQETYDWTRKTRVRGDSSVFKPKNWQPEIDEINRVYLLKKDIGLPD
ncbi:MAG: hypothetical protein J6S14_15795 [Clostridia bacterium]|nr:hypothetical protein [Clostridia bacterium]